ncbi:MAG: 2-C-methyl-D-erythritol 4-phosphate cytidylyltransferase [Acidobacteria bacterium]|nr:2-C-methyl-D-erythritol 4-phosphate cytidylyltransferase [Acidobacteriota bacterium]
MKVIVLIPAAGLGTRMAPPRPGKRKTKQFTDLDGTPILIHTLRKFAAVAAVAEIYIALRPEEMPEFRSRLDKETDIMRKHVELVEGGEHRQKSVGNALAAILASADDIVLVHDAVRPFVSQETIREVIQAARKYGAAIAGMPAVDTVKQVERTAQGALITSTIPRERVVMAQTPQGFHYGILKKAFDEAAADGFVGTDEASLVERAGGEVAVVMGSPKNIKITTPSDMELAEFFLKK